MSCIGVRSTQAVAQTNHLPFDWLSLPAEQDLWQAGVNKVYVEIMLSPSFDFAQDIREKRSSCPSRAGSGQGACRRRTAAYETRERQVVFQSSL